MEILVPSRGNRYLSSGNWIPILYLEQQDEEDLVDRHLCYAPRDRRNNGDVPLRLDHDYS